MEALPQKHFESRFTSFYEGYWLYERFGFDVRRVQLSSLIVTNQITRKEGLDIIKKSPMDPNMVSLEKQYIADKLRISKEELDRFFNMPIKTYKDYPNDSWLYSLGAKILRFFGKEIGGKLL